MKIERITQKQIQALVDRHPKDLLLKFAVINLTTLLHNCADPESQDLELKPELQKATELSTQVESQNKRINELEKELQAWKDHARELSYWGHGNLQHADSGFCMERNMGKPNAPNYITANND